MILKVVRTVGDIVRIERLECALISVITVGTQTQIIIAEQYGGIQHEVLVFDSAENTSARKTEYEIIS